MVTFLLVSAASPVSVIWRASKLSDLKEDSPQSFFRPLSVTTVKDRFKLSRFLNPAH